MVVKSMEGVRKIFFALMKIASSATVTCGVTTFQRNQVVRTLSFLTRFERGSSWSVFFKEQLKVKVE